MREKKVKIKSNWVMFDGEERLLEFMYEFDMADEKEFTWVEFSKIIARIRRKLYKEILLTNLTPSLIKKGKKNGR
jgi:hypothetical protein